MLKSKFAVLAAGLVVLAVSGCEPLINPGKSGRLGTSGCIVLDQGSYKESMDVPFEWRYLEFSDTALGLSRYSSNTDCLPDWDDSDYVIRKEYMQIPRLGRQRTAHIANVCYASAPYVTLNSYAPAGSAKGEWHVPTTYELYQASILVRSDPDRFGHLVNRTYSTSELYQSSVVCMTFYRDREPVVSYRSPLVPQTFLLFRAF